LSPSIIAFYRFLTGFDAGSNPVNHHAIISGHLPHQDLLILATVRVDLRLGFSLAEIRTLTFRGNTPDNPLQGDLAQEGITPA
jgi:hypothetical protein